MAITEDQRQNRVLTDEQKEALARINFHLDCIKDTINANFDKYNKNDWLTLTYDHMHRSNGNEFKEDIEPRVKNLRVD